MDFSYVFKEGFETTGVGELDLILLGGYRRPSFNEFRYLNKDIAEVLAVGLLSNLESFNIYISTEKPASEVLEKAKGKAKIDAVLDLYTIPAGISQEEIPGALYLEGAVALNDISFEINKLIRSAEKPPRLVIDNLSTFLLYNPIDSLLKFLNVLKGRMNEREGITLALMDKGVEKEGTEVVERVFDEIFEEKGEDGKRYLYTDRYPFGIEFEVIEGIMRIP